MGRHHECFNAIHTKHTVIVQKRKKKKKKKQGTGDMLTRRAHKLKLMLNSLIASLHSSVEV